MTNPSLVSICIPTYNRPHLLRLALESCFAQTLENFEVVVGDDSNSNASELVVAEFQALYPGKLRYFRNVPSLGQAANVNALFANAAGDRLVLLHDDDLLMPAALKELSECWATAPDLSGAFGKQYMIDMAGKILSEQSEALNKFYGRTAAAAGEVIPGLAAIGGMFPNDGYMILTERARAIGYLVPDEMKDACDSLFALKYCADNARIWFLNNYVSAYRISDDGISRSSITAPSVYEALIRERARWQSLRPEVRLALREALDRVTPDAASGYARLGKGKAALRIILSSDYPIRKRFSLKFVLHCALTLVSLIKGAKGVQAVSWLSDRTPRSAKSRKAAR